MTTFDGPLVPNGNQVTVKTVIRPSPESPKPLHCGSVAARKFCQFGGFCGNLHQISCCFVAKFLPSGAFFHGKIPKKNILFCWKLSTKTAATLLEISTKKFPLCLISTKKCLYGKYPQKICLYEKLSQNFAWLENFHNNRLSWKISAKSCFFKTFPQNLV